MPSMNLNPFRSLANKIAVAFFITTALPLVVGLSIVNEHAHNEAQADAHRELLEVASSRERLLSEHIRGIQSHAEAIAGAPSVISFAKSTDIGAAVDDATLVAAARDLASFQHALWGDTHHVFLADPTGRVVLSPPGSGWEREGLTPEQIDASQGVHFGDAISGVDYFERAHHEPTVSGFFDFTERDHYHQLAMHPVKAPGGRTVGIVVVEIDILRALEVLHESFSMGSTGRIYLTTSKGTRVVHRKSDRHTVDGLPEGLSRAILSGEPEAGRFDHAGGDVHGGYLPSHVYPWVVCIEMDHDEVVAHARAQLGLYTVIGLVGLTLSALVAGLFARFFGAPLQSLVDSATAVASGDLNREIEITSDDEIGKLQTAVDAMRIALKNQIEHLDSAVGERTEQLVALNKKLKHDAECDKLTGLANRDVLRRRLSEEIDAFRNDPDHRFAVLFFDFDRFKLVNDSLGHAAGDALLCSIADRFREHLRASDTVARFGGDEFVVVLSPLKSDAHAREAAQRLLSIFEAPHVLDGHEIVSTASVGLLYADRRYLDADDMIRDADAAMYQAKLDGKDRVVGFDAEMHERAKRRLKLEEDLNRAVDGEQLRLAYQPIIDLDTLGVAGFEALIRWDHPELGFVSPDQFIDVAEDTGQIVRIGRWVIEQAVRDILDWNERFPGTESLSVNVNVSKRQLIDDSFMPHLRKTLESSGLDPSQLKVELTESTIVDPRAAESMSTLFDQIRSLGVQIAMDDFGTGQSSLGLLHKYNFDVLKIDRAFIEEMDLNRDIGAVLHAIIELAKNSDMSIVAEGVETESQVTALIAHGCDKVQGFYFARPMFVDDVIEYLSTPRHGRRAA